MKAVIPQRILNLPRHQQIAVKKAVIFNYMKLLCDYYHLPFGYIKYCDTGHAVPITSIDISNDSKFAIIGFEDHTARLFDLQKNTYRTLQAHVEKISYVAISPDNQFILTHSNRDNATFLWDFAQLQPVKLIITDKYENDGKVLSLESLSYLFNKEASVLLITSHTEYLHSGRLCESRLWDLSEFPNVTSRVIKIFNVRQPIDDIGLFLSDDGSTALFNYEHCELVDVISRKSTVIASGRKTAALGSNGKYIVARENDIYYMYIITKIGDIMHLTDKKLLNIENRGKILGIKDNKWLIIEEEGRTYRKKHTIYLISLETSNLSSILHDSVKDIRVIGSLLSPHTYVSIVGWGSSESTITFAKLEKGVNELNPGIFTTTFQHPSTISDNGTIATSGPEWKSKYYQVYSFESPELESKSLEELVYIIEQKLNKPFVFENEVNLHYIMSLQSPNNDSILPSLGDTDSNRQTTSIYFPKILSSIARVFIILFLFFIAMAFIIPLIDMRLIIGVIIGAVLVIGFRAVTEPND